MRSTYAATRATQRSSPSTKSKIPRGYRVVNSSAMPAKKTSRPIRPVSNPMPHTHSSTLGRGVAPTAEEDPHDDVVRDREQPRLDEHEPARQLLRIWDVEPRRIVGHVVERERWVPVGAKRGVRVEGDPPGPAEDAEVEVEDAARVPPGEEDREERDDRQDEDRQPQEREHDVVGDRQQPLDEPQPAAQLAGRAVPRSGLGTSGGLPASSPRSVSWHSCTWSQPTTSRRPKRRSAPEQRDARPKARRKRLPHSLHVLERQLAASP